jgi:splicing factor U2AF subunit
VEPPSEVLVLKNIIYHEELVVDEEYSEILKDMELEASKFGTVIQIKIPKFDPKKKENFGLGNVYIRFANVNQAKNARRDLVKRLFRKRIVEACYHGLGKFLSDDFQLKSHYMGMVS